MPFANRNRPSRRNRRAADPSVKEMTPDVAVQSVAISANNLLVTLASSMIYRGGIPAITCQGVLPTAIASITGTTFILDYAANVVATNAVAIPTQDPCFRTSGGGYIKAGNFLVP